MQEYETAGNRTEHLGVGTMLRLTRLALRSEQNPKEVRQLLPRRLDVDEAYGVLHQVYDGISRESKGLMPEGITKYMGYKTLQWLGKMSAVGGDTMTTVSVLTLFEEEGNYLSHRMAGSLMGYVVATNSPD